MSTEHATASRKTVTGEWIGTREIHVARVRYPLDNVFKYAHTVDVMRTYSTSEVAKRVGVDKKTLLRWLWAGKISEPKHHTNGGQDVRIWSDRDLLSVRRFKEAKYRKGRGRKKST
jgi:excisionase family DNA binding protein